ncbi:MAG: cell division protein SepF, partial [Clostridia bacterium]|nr:cell division protein SepF [Clostridia bacterium]
NFDEAEEIGFHIKQKRACAVNLHRMPNEYRQRIIDFLSGVAYANAGMLKRVANSTFIITPYNVSMTGDLLDELESNGMFFSGQ